MEGTRGRRALVDRLATSKEASMGAWCDIYQSILDGRGLAENSLSVFSSRLKTVRTAWGEMRIDAITTRDVADFLEQWERQGKKRMASAMRALVNDLFRAAQAKGWVAHNPVTPTKIGSVEVKRARLTLEMFQSIHAAALKHQPAWVARSMELALVTGQRREDVAAFGPRNVRDGRLWVEQGKTKAKVCIPLDLRMNAVGWSVGEVIARCRDNVLSRHFVHHSSNVGGIKAGSGVSLNTISAAFSEARRKSRIAWGEGKDPPTFHEIRSLSARLYAAQGVNAQALLGHKSPDMTALYRDARGSEWIEVATG
ncbi:tyrosine-type recombinase/integrase [Azospirillum formosense]|uniref:tyrosine-type recombinase/integrase n=1 Tax=Azospirillum formosense TaxID=861533 RepID=UPI00338F9C89